MIYGYLNGTLSLNLPFKSALMGGVYERTTQLCRGSEVYLDIV